MAVILIFSVLAKRLAGMSISNMTYLVLSQILNLTHFLLVKMVLNWLRRLSQWLRVLLYCDWLVRISMNIHVDTWNIAVCRVLHIEAKSFQDLPLQFRVTTDDTVARDTFRVDVDSGSVTLLRTLSYAVDQHQYQFNLSVTERYSDFVSSAPVTLLELLLLTDTSVSFCHCT